MKPKSRQVPSKSESMRESSTLLPEQIDGVLKHILTSTLALYVLNNDKRPISDVMSELAEVEYKASQLIELIVRLQTGNFKKINLEGALEGVFSFIRMPLVSAISKAKPYTLPSPKQNNRKKIPPKTTNQKTPNTTRRTKKK